MSSSLSPTSSSGDYTNRSTSAASSSSSLSPSGASNKETDTACDDAPSCSTPTSLDLSTLSLEDLPLRYTVPSCGFRPLALTDLNLSRNAIQQIHAPIDTLVNLERLDLSQNQLIELPPQLAKLSHLRWLACQTNALEFLPGWLTVLTRLRGINAGANRLTEFPAVLLRMPWLEKLYLGGNQIQAIPDEIALMQSLDALYLGGNLLTEIPVTIGQLHRLTALVLAGNRLETLPTAVAQLRRLETLALHDNQLRTLPTQIIRLKNLQNLSLRNNPLVHEFVAAVDVSPPTLQELAGRAVRQHFSASFYSKILPRELVRYLGTASHCVNPSCKGVYFEACVEHVKFVDFCGKYRVPLLQFLCSIRCTDAPLDSSSSPSMSESSEASDVEDGRQLWERRRQFKMRKVLLG